MKPDILYLTNGCGENAHGDERYFRQFGLKYGGWNPNTGKLENLSIDGEMPEGCEFYPLTPSEAQYTTADVFSSPEGPGMLAYSVLFRGEKYLAPQVEVAFAAEWNEAEYNREQALIEAERLANKARKVIEAIGGKVLVLSDQADDRHTVIALVPFHYALGVSYQHYKATVETAFNGKPDHQ